MLTWDGLIFCLHTCDVTVFPANTGDLRIEANLTAKAYDPLADILNHIQKDIRANMGLGVKEDILLRPGCHHLLQDPGDPGVIQAGIQFTIRKSTCTAFTKLNIGCLVQDFVGKEVIDILGS